MIVVMTGMQGSEQKHILHFCVFLLFQKSRLVSAMVSKSKKAALAAKKK